VHFCRISDGDGKRRAFETSADSIAEVIVGTDAKLFGSLRDRGEDVHRSSTAHAAAVQAHVATACAHACLEFRAVVVQWNFRHREHRQQLVFLGRRLRNAIIQSGVVGASGKQVVEFVP